MKTLRIPRQVPVGSLAMAAGLMLASTAAMAQATVGGAGGAGGIGDAIVTYFYNNYMHAIAVAGLLSILVGALFMRSHIMYFVVVGIILLCIGNYASIIALFGIA